MAYESFENHNDLIVQTGFRMEILGNILSSVVRVGGLNRNTGTIEWVDGGSGYKEFFTDQIKTHGPLSIVYRIDPTKSDAALLKTYVDNSMNLGVRYDFSLIKYHHQFEQFRVLCYRGGFFNEQISDFDNNASGPLEITLEVPIAKFELI